jgi:hypothetical protein
MRRVPRYVTKATPSASQWTETSLQITSCAGCVFWSRGRRSITCWRVKTAPEAPNSKNSSASNPATSSGEERISGRCSFCSNSHSKALCSSRCIYGPPLRRQTLQTSPSHYNPLRAVLEPAATLNRGNVRFPSDQVIRLRIANGENPTRSGRSTPRRRATRMELPQVRKRHPYPACLLDGRG